jgi:6-phosphogluconolactonase (cycloisomerase 2 family)
MASIAITTRRSLAILLALGIVAAALLATVAGASAQGNDNHAMIFTMTNASDGNQVVAYERDANGALTMAESYATGGNGNGAGLGSQGALVLTDNGRWLLAVNAGSNSVSVFRVNPSGLMLRDVVPSGGEMPISITVHGRMVYVLNGGGVENISGFMLHPNGMLQAVEGSSRPLSGTGVGPAQVQFTPDGRALVVTEKATNKIDVFLVYDIGFASMPVVNESIGMSPLGFDIKPDGTLVVSEAFGGAADASALSSYQITIDGTLQLVSGSAATTETAACWVVITPDGRYAYTTNNGSGSVSGYHVDQSGALALLNADGQTGLTGAGSGPIDAIDAGDGQFLYVLNAGDDSISIFGINADGSLSDLGKVTGLAPSTVGLAGR